MWQHLKQMFHAEIQLVIEFYRAKILLLIENFNLIGLPILYETNHS